MTLYDCIWYLPQQKANAFAQLRIPGAEERAARGVFGIGWGPNQPKPLPDDSWEQHRRQEVQTGAQFDGSVKQEWTWLFANIPGMSRDPDLARSDCTLEQIAPGLIGGRIKEEVRQSEQWQERAVATSQAESEKLATIDTEAEQRAIARSEALRDLCVTTAVRVGIRNAERLTDVQLANQFKFVRLTQEFPLPDEVRWVEDSVPPDPIPITLENVGDWEKYMSDAYMSVVASPKMIPRKK